MQRSFLLAALGFLAAAAGFDTARGDEGMWTFDAFPSQKVAAAYGVTIDKAWLDHLQASTVRLTSGCSGAVVSPAGLVLTNHHCVIECLQDLSDPTTDYVKDGFLTTARREERACPGMQAEILESITDLTPAMAEATAGKTGQAFVRAREAAAARAEEEACPDSARHRCEVVTLYRGGAYKLYKHRRYAEVRLVFAPEYAIAFFGGDPDNFNFPRHNLDAAFLRLYETGVPADTPRSLKWSQRAPKVGEPTFVAGSPASTERLLTVAQLESLRDLAIPVAQLQRSELRGRLLQFSQASDEHRRLALDPLFGVENAFKVYYGRQATLSDPAFMAGKRADEADLRARVAADPKLAAEIGDPWRDIQLAQVAYAANFIRHRQFEAAAGGGSTLFSYARKLVRAAHEGAKPSDQRLSDYADANLPLLRKQLLDARPVAGPVEEIYLAFWLSKTREYLTADDRAVKLLLGKETPEGMAARLVAGSRLADPAVRRALWDGGAAAVEESGDPLIQLALKLEPAVQDVRRRWDREVTGPVDAAAERIARARLAVLAGEVYPDATFTPRISYGKVAGWSYRGAAVAPTTVFGDLYERAADVEPYALPQRWIAAKGQLNRQTVFNFTTTNDIIGGNSGSPVVDSSGELLGAAFDGNIHSLGGAYGYDAATNRTVVVSTAAITEALEKVYGRPGLMQELLAR